MPTTLARLLFLLLAAGWLASGVASAAEAVRLTIEIHGLSDAVTESVLGQLSIERERDHPLLDVYRMQQLHQRAPAEIKEALQPFGFYSAMVNSALTQQKDGTWLAVYNVNPGVPILIDAVNITLSGPGAEDAAFVQWKARYPLRHGDILMHETYEDAKQELQRLAGDEGYLKAHFERKQILVDVAQHSAVIELVFATGERYRYGEIRVTPTQLDDELVQNYLFIKPGEYYDADRLLEMQRNLADSDYFQRADVVPAVEEAHDGVVPIDVKLTMRKRTRYSMGVGYATDTGPHATLGMERRYVNSHGHRFGAEVITSEVRNTVTGRYRIPLSKPATDAFTINGEWEEETLEDSHRETVTAGIAHIRQLSFWQQTVGLSYELESFNVGDNFGHTILLIPGVRWQRIEADNRIFTRKGWRVGFGVKGATDQVVSDISFVQLDMHGKLIWPLWGGRIITRADLGTSAVAKFQELPLSQRFFAGGDFSVRGYAYKSLGPTDANGDVVGGRHLLVGSVEYDYYLGKRFGMAAFYDAGNAFDFSQFDIYKGAGVGGRWRFPFGVLRVDVAAALGDPQHDWRLHISIGPDL